MQTHSVFAMGYRIILGYNVDLLDMGTYDNCEKACKVRKPLPDTEAGVGGTTNDYRTTTASYVDEYRPCNYDICPVAAGETIHELPMTNR